MEKSYKHNQIILLIVPYIFNWLDSLICPHELLLIIFHLFVVHVLVLWVGLGINKQLKLGREKYLCMVTYWTLLQMFKGAFIQALPSYCMLIKISAWKHPKIWCPPSTIYLGSMQPLNILKPPPLKLLPYFHETIVPSLVKHYFFLNYQNCDKCLFALVKVRKMV